MNKLYRPIDIANYIIKRAVDKGQPITHLKLQKLLYYVVAKYFKDNSSKLINESISKWQYGPVVESVYHYLKIYGSSEIKAPIKYITSEGILNLKFADVGIMNSKIESDDKVKNAIDYVLNKLLERSASDLVERTHKEKAWKQNESKILSSVNDLTYSDKELMDADI